jgi:phosphoribosylanthranilate isomerase
MKHARVVALSLSTDPERILATAELLKPAIVHLARAHQMTPETLTHLRMRLDPRELMLTVPMVGDHSIVLARQLALIGDFLLLDTSHPASGVVGATGLVHDWELSALIVAATECPVVLAGGLGPDNVVEAIRCVNPAGVDSETRTSRTDDRRRKDIAKVEAFIANAKSSATD